MTTVVQQTYRSGIRRALPGMIADLTDYSIVTRLCLTAAGIPFGRACSRSGDTGAIIGGGLPGSVAAMSFIGISCADITLDGMPIDPLIDTHGEVDIYQVNRNMGLLTRGRIWIEADDTIAANDAVYYDFNTGRLGNSASGMPASGYVDFKTNPVDAKTITLGGVVTTFKDVITNAAVQCQIGATTRQTVINLAAFLNAASDETLNDCTYKQVTTDDAERLMIVHDTVGTAGNTFGVATNVDNATVSGATLSGGYGGSYATGDVIFTVNPTDGEKITIGGADVIFKDTPGAGEVDIGGDLTTSIDNMVTALNHAADYPGNDTDIAKFTWSNVGGTRLRGISDTVGTANNAITLSTDVVGATVSGSTMTGGAPASIALTNAKWIQGALAGELALLSLALQR